MTRYAIINEYFEWLFGLVCGDRYSKKLSYRKLLMRLHDIEFTYTIELDGNRAKDGIELRSTFIYEFGYDEEFEQYLDGPCSVLEMMIALATRCEDYIMTDSDIGDRTGQWFWGMITNLGLGSMVDSRFDREYVDKTIDIFLKREYEPDGTGGLFRVRHYKGDLRTIEIWYQLCWYLDSIS